MVRDSTDRFNGVLASLAVKTPCAAVALTNITLSGEQTVNSVAVVSGDRVLVTAQTSSIDNGIWDVSTSGWTRAADFDGNRDIVRGTLVSVHKSDGFRDVYEQTEIEPEIGTDDIEFRLFYASTLYSSGGGFSGIHNDWIDIFVTNILELNGRPLSNFTILNQAVGSVSNVATIDYELGQGVTLTLTENITTLTLSNIPATNLAQLEIDIRQDSSARTIAWPAAIKWPGGTEPDITTVSSITQVHLRTTDGGTTWLGTYAENES